MRFVLSAFAAHLARGSGKYEQKRWDRGGSKWVGARGKAGEGRGKAGVGVGKKAAASENLENISILKTQNRRK